MLNDNSLNGAPDAVGVAGKRGVATLGERLDEAAIEVRGATAGRISLTLAGALLCLLLIPFRQAAIWFGVSAVIEAWSWSATRCHGGREPAGGPARWSFAGSYLAQLLCWLACGFLFISSGTLAGEASGAVVFVALAAVAVLLFHNTPALFVLAGVAPATAALSVFALRDGHSWREIAPIWIAVGLGCTFILGRALELPSAQESKRRLNHSLKQYRMLADNVTDLISRTDLNGVSEFMSPSVFEILGYRPEELVGGSHWGLLDPESQIVIRQALRRMIADPQRTEAITSRVRHKDGHWIWLQSSARLVFENQVAVGVIDVSRDVTERVAIEAALREAKTQAEAATQAKAEFLANVSHEIRTPLNGILGAVHLLGDEPISAEGRALMRQADDCGRMLDRLLNDVLDFSKIEAGQLDLTPEPTNIGEALQAVSAMLRAQAQAKGVEFRCDIDGADLWVEADPVRLQQVMFNLIGNAVKFTDNGFIAARLVVRDAGVGVRRVRFEVEDSGIGISSAAQDRLFERFHQGDGATARRYGGAGLGLAITQGLVRQMGGDIRCKSAEGEGSTFWLEFDAPAARRGVMEPRDEGLLDGVRILLVDDNPTNRTVARTLLARLGATVEEAEDGVAALTAAQLGAYDLILMDIQMPNMNGVEATRAIRGLSGAAGRVPIIGLTANALAHQRVEYLAAGMDGVVAKPISPALFLAEIGRLMSREEQREAG